MKKRGSPAQNLSRGRICTAMLRCDGATVHADSPRDTCRACTVELEKRAKAKGGVS